MLETVGSIRHQESEYPERFGSFFSYLKQIVRLCRCYIPIIWITINCSLVGGYRHSGEKCCLLIRTYIFFHTRRQGLRTQKKILEFSLTREPKIEMSLVLKCKCEFLFLLLFLRLSRGFSA